MLFEILYGLLFVLTLASAIMVVASAHALYSALYLVLTMVAVACLFLLMNAQLAAAFQVIVYAGAIVVLFLFVIMLLNLGRRTARTERNQMVRWLGLLLAAGFFIQIGAMLLAMRGSLPLPVGEPVSIPARDFAILLLTDYLYAFEMISVLLLVAVIGAVVLARRHLVQGTEEIVLAPADSQNSPAPKGTH